MNIVIESIFYQFLMSIFLEKNMIGWILTNAGELGNAWVELESNLSIIWSLRRYAGTSVILWTVIVCCIMLKCTVELTSDVLLFPIQVLTGVKVRHTCTCSHVINDNRLSLNMNILITSVQNCLTSLLIVTTVCKPSVSSTASIQDSLRSCWIVLGIDITALSLVPKEGMSCKSLSVKNLLLDW